MSEIITKAILFMLYLPVLIWVLDFFKGQLFIQITLLIIFSVCYSIIESKVMYYAKSIIQKMGGF
ncbi:ABC-type multidrug transport system permease subunit [Paenibacillus sp. OAS669]|nr:ABC-type multidrug transport system permease subunit [Paenibacillus sp. OAS669]